MEPLNAPEIRKAVQLALAEDVGSGDATTLAAVPAGTQARALMRAREPLIVAGLAFAETAFHDLSPELAINLAAKDGDRVAAGSIMMDISGSAQAILSAERVALNFIQRLSGVATLTARYVEAVKGTHTKILDTRKTTPGWRRFEKYAVARGGGGHYRLGLYDMVLIKDNHLAALRDASPNPVAAAVRRARAAYPNLRIEVEADHLGQVDQALDAGADIILLDNMDVPTMRMAVDKCKGRAQTEASGGITLEKIPQIAATGVDFISVGALTHSARAVDIGLDFEMHA
jgi:nicotinate-nucleotide pyrophosphorylase (carboxylating)